MTTTNGTNPHPPAAMPRPAPTRHLVVELRDGNCVDTDEPTPAEVADWLRDRGYFVELTSQMVARRADPEFEAKLIKAGLVTPGRGAGTDFVEAPNEWRIYSTNNGADISMKRKSDGKVMFTTEDVKAAAPYVAKACAKHEATGARVGSCTACLTLNDDGGASSSIVFGVSEPPPEIPPLIQGRRSSDGEIVERTIEEHFADVSRGNGNPFAPHGEPRLFREEPPVKNSLTYDDIVEHVRQTIKEEREGDGFEWIDGHVTIPERELTRLLTERDQLRAALAEMQKRETNERKARQGKAAE